MLPCYQLHSRFIPARYQPALLLEYAQSQDLDCMLLLATSGLSKTGELASDASLSPAEYLQLLQRIHQSLPGAETALQLGQQLLPGQLGPISHALLQAPSLGHALDLLLRYQAWLSPLMAPHLMQLGERTLLYWSDACISPRLRGFAVDMMMAAVTGMSRWLSGERLPWTYHFNRTRPAGLEQYTVHLGSALRFDDCLDAMSIPSEWLARPWPRGSLTRMQQALEESEAMTARPPKLSLLAALYDYLSGQLRNNPCLEDASAAFGSSPATFKRHLALHGTHFQAELDQVRTHVTLQLIHNQGYSNEQIAAWLGFHDATNFRRSFKRWTGLTPSMLRSRLLPES